MYIEISWYQGVRVSFLRRSLYLCSHVHNLNSVEWGLSKCTIAGFDLIKYFRRDGTTFTCLWMHDDLI